jgi:hypothetical protein
VTPQRILPALLLSAGLLATLPAFAQKEQTLYHGDPVAGQGIALGGWGSGYAIQSQQEYYSGTNSIQIQTDGYYAGGRIDFTTPVDLTDALSDRDVYLVFTVRFPGLADEGDVIGDVGGPIGPVTPGVGPYTGGTGPAGGAAGGTGDNAPPKMGFFRVVAMVNGANLVAEDQPIDLRKTDSGWTTLSVPLAAFKGPRPTSGKAMLTRLSLFGDRPDKFYVGEISARIDDEDIYLDVEPEEQAVFPGDSLQLSASANGGLANIEYVWDFDSKDGLQEDAYGETVTHSWKDSGTYTVTLRVRDINGVKPELKFEVPITVAE